MRRRKYQRSGSSRTDLKRNRFQRVGYPKSRIRRKLDSISMRLQKCIEDIEALIKDAEDDVDVEALDESIMHLEEADTIVQHEIPISTM